MTFLFNEYLYFKLYGRQNFNVDDISYTSNTRVRETCVKGSLCKDVLKHLTKNDIDL